MKKQVKRLSFEDRVILAVNAEIVKLEVKSIDAVRDIIKKISTETGYDTFSLAYMYGVA